MDQLCRICLNTVMESDSTNLLASPNSNEQTLLEMLVAICSQVFSTIQIGEDVGTLPLEVCSECTGKICSAYELFQMCVDSNRKLLEMMLEEQNKSMEAVEVLDKDQKLEEAMEVEEDSTEVTPAKVEKACGICHRVLKTSKALTRHMAKIHHIEAHTCSDCQEDFYSKESLENHKLYHEKEQSYDCIKCNITFNTSSALREHQQQVHSASFLCTTCGKSFNNRSNLRQHVIRHTDQKRFACDKCPVRFHSKGSLKNHQQTHTKEKPFACDICGSRFTMKHTLIKHRQIHSGEGRPFECTMCKLKFSNKHHLTRHLRVHSGEKPFKCKLCDRAFAQSNDLVKHSQRTHFGENLYPCSRCEESFRLLVELKDHYKIHFQNEGSESNEEIRFTSVSMIEKRLEQEQRPRPRENRTDRVRLEQVVATSVDIADIPAVVELRSD